MICSVIVWFAIISGVRIIHSRPLLHRKDVCSSVRLRLIIQPSRHIPDSHVVPDGIAITGRVDNGVRVRGEGYLCGPSFAKELGVEVYAFAVDLLDISCGVRKVARVKVPADTELVAYVELDFLAFEGVADRFGNISL